MPLQPRDPTPDEVVLDVVLRWSDKLHELHHASIKRDATRPKYSLFLTMLNHLEQRVSLVTPVHFDGKPSIDPLRFVLLRLGPGVWKLGPSIHQRGLIHAYVTIIDVPEPPPWSA